MTRRESLVAMLGAVMGVSQKGIPGTRAMEITPIVSPSGRRIATKYRFRVNRQWEFVEVFGPPAVGDIRFADKDFAANGVWDGNKWIEMWR